MIPFEEAYRIATQATELAGTEYIHMTDCGGRILASDVFSDTDLPPFNKSAVDGYACRKADLANELELLEIIPAGKQPHHIIGRDQCSKIMTGSMVPEGADCVIMVEHTETTATGRIRFLRNDTAPNICYRGEDILKGKPVLCKGTRVGAAHIAVLASVGCVRPEVYRTASVGIISTGDELTEPENVPKTGQIRNSNAWQLMEQLKQTACRANYHGIAPDNENDTYRFISEALALNDVIILTGGVSMGDFDFVPGMMEKAGIKVLFKSIAIQPGRPTVFGKAGKKLCFGLPGNPVSSYIIFELLVKPCLMKYSGYNGHPFSIKLKTGCDFQRKRAERMAVLPVTADMNGLVWPVDYHGSAHIHAMTTATALAFIPAGITLIKAGEDIHVRQL